MTGPKGDLLDEDEITRQFPFGIWDEDSSLAPLDQARAEKIGKTKQLTEEIDTLEHAIKYMKSKIPNETSTK